MTRVPDILGIIVPLPVLQEADQKALRISIEWSQFPASSPLPQELGADAVNTGNGW